MLILLFLMSLRTFPTTVAVLFLGRNALKSNILQSGLDQSLLWVCFRVLHLSILGQETHKKDMCQLWGCALLELSKSHSGTRDSGITGSSLFPGPALTSSLRFCFRGGHRLNLGQAEWLWFRGNVNHWVKDIKKYKRGVKGREKSRLVLEGSPSGAHCIAEVYLASQNIVKEWLPK